MSANSRKAVDIPSDLLENLKPEELEHKYVHQVYDDIAGHFSATRYKPWPVVESFIKDIPMGSILLDIGCGNGKYLATRPKNEIIAIGTDRSSHLVQICNERGFDAFVGDALTTGFRKGVADYVISIAVIHHIVTIERRRKAVDELLDILRPGGMALIFVWALEQNHFNRRGFEAEHSSPISPSDRPNGPPQTTLTSSEEESKKGRDMFVPWNRKTKSIAKAEDSSNPSSITMEPTNDTNTPTNDTFQRYYHLFTKGELESLIEHSKCGRIVESGYDKDNWWAKVEKIAGIK